VIAALSFSPDRDASINRLIAAIDQDRAELLAAMIGGQAVHREPRHIRRDLPNFLRVRSPPAATIFLLAGREFVLQFGEAAPRHVLQLSRSVEEHLSLVIGNANCSHACMEGRGEQHRGGNIDLGSEPHRAWIVDRLQFVTEHYSLLRL